MRGSFAPRRVRRGSERGGGGWGEKNKKNERVALVRERFEVGVVGDPAIASAVCRARRSGQPTIAYVPSGKRNKEGNAALLSGPGSRVTKLGNLFHLVLEEFVSQEGGYQVRSVFRISEGKEKRKERRGVGGDWLWLL